MNIAKQVNGWWRQIFVVYAIVLFTATHWPQLRIDGPPIRTDLIIHFGAFGAWAFFFAATAWVGNWNSWRGLRWPFVIGILYAAIDEGSQAIPAIGRTCAWDDFAANCGGIFLGILAARIVGAGFARHVNT